MSVNLVAHCMLQYMAGGSYHDRLLYVGMSAPFKRSVKKGIDDKTLAIVVAPAYVVRKQPKQGLSFYVWERVEFQIHMHQLEKEDPCAFHSLYRMEHASFLKLLLSSLSLCTFGPQNGQNTNWERANINRHCCPLFVEVACRWVLPWHLLGSRNFCQQPLQVHPPLHQCCPKMQGDELFFSVKSGRHWKRCWWIQSILTSGVIDGCVACLDGLLVQIQPPSPDETGHVKSYFSGHYQTYGINVQAACDSKCWFVYAALVAPGGLNDIAAFCETKLHAKMNSLPWGKYIIADNAYVCSENLLTPFSGDVKKDIKKHL